MDVAPVSRLPGFVLTPEPHVLAFYDILLVTRGRGTYLEDGVRFPVRPGQVFFTSPGQVRQWKATGVDGLCCFFPGEFLEGFLADPLFLYRLPFFHREGPPAPLGLARPEIRRLTGLLHDMEAEIRDLKGDSPTLLGARLYEALVLLERWFRRAHPFPAHAIAEGLGLRFRRLVEHRYRDVHRVGGYARLLAVSPSHLNAQVRRQLGRSPSRLIQERLALEARRLLLYTDETAARIGYALGFEDPSYFTRFFRRRTGRTPTDFRTAAVDRDPRRLADAIDR